MSPELGPFDGGAMLVSAGQAIAALQGQGAGLSPGQWCRQAGEDRRVINVRCLRTGLPTQLVVAGLGLDGPYMALRSHNRRSALGSSSCGCGAITAAFHDQKDDQHHFGDLVGDAVTSWGLLGELSLVWTAGSAGCHR